MVPSVILTLLNILLSRTIKFFTKFEKFDSITAYNTAVSCKMTTALFIDTAIIVFMVYRDNWYGGDALIVEVYNIIIANAILTPVFYLLDLEHIILKFRQWGEQRKGRSRLTQ